MEQVPVPLSIKVALSTMKSPKKITVVDSVDNKIIVKFTLN